MATLTVIGEPFPDIEARVQASAARCLTDAVAVAAPRGCSARLILARDAVFPQLESPKARVESVPLNTGALPILWRAGATARPLDGEFVHAVTPLVPLRNRREDDGSQTSVMVPHTLAWHAPELMGATHAKAFRSFVKRAAKLADVLLAPSHAVATDLEELTGLEVRVLQLAPPREFLPAEDSAGTRAELGLPSRYVATTALPGDHGRLGWLLDAMQNDASLPPLVVLHLGTDPLPPVREALAERVHVVQVEELHEIGAVISGALLLALPQVMIGAGFEVLGALAAAVPVLHADCAATAELALDGGVRVENEAEFAAALARLTEGDSEGGASAELRQLRAFAEDRSRSFSWQVTAWQLWELHANL